MNTKLTTLIAILGFALAGCKQSTEITKKDGDRLHLTGEIAREIENAHQIECEAFVRLKGDVAGIELNVKDPNIDHQSLATKIMEMKSVRSFQGSLQLTFVHRKEPQGPPAMWIKYDAKTAKRIEQ